MLKRLISKISATAPATAILPFFAFMACFRHEAAQPAEETYSRPERSEQAANAASSASGCMPLRKASTLSWSRRPAGASTDVAMERGFRFILGILEWFSGEARWR